MSEPRGQQMGGVMDGGSDGCHLKTTPTSHREHFKYLSIRSLFGKRGTFTFQLHTQMRTREFRRILQVKLYWNDTHVAKYYTSYFYVTVSVTLDASLCSVCMCVCIVCLWRGLIWFILGSHFPKKCDSMYQHCACMERKLYHCKNIEETHNNIVL